MKILALDVDGVLNSGKYLKQSLLEDEEGCILEQEKLSIIKDVLEKDKEIKIIMNSSWNASFDLDSYKQLFLKFDNNFPVDRIIDVTDSSKDKSDALEIWLNKNEIFSFAVVDDDFLFDLEHPYFEYHLKTSYYIGLTKEHSSIILESMNIPFFKSF